MSEVKTKSCNLTELEIKTAIAGHCHAVLNTPQEDSIDDHIERMNYLNKRLKTFSEPEVKAPEAPAANTGVWPNG